MKAGWETKRIGDVAKVSAGNSAPQNKSLFVDGTYPFFRTADAGKIRFGVIYESADYLNNEGIKGLRPYQKGTILFPKSGASTFINHRVILGVDGFVSSHLATIVADKKRAEPRYLLYFLATISAQDLVQDHAYPSLNLPTIADIKISLPPLPEQQRIVTILDQAFDGIATAKANAEKNLKNAREIFESHLNAVFTQRGEGWVEKNLGEACVLVTKGSSPKWQGIEYIDNPGILFVTSENVGCNEMIFKNQKYVEESFNQKDKKSILQRGDVLTNIVGASIGRTAVFDRDDLANINQAVCLMRCNPEKLANKYLAYLLNSPFFRQVLHDNEIDNARANLSLGFFKNLSVPVPPIEKQLAVVAEIDGLNEETQRLESIYQQKLDALDELKKSLLHQAFTGELTTSPDKQLDEALT